MKTVILRFARQSPAVVLAMLALFVALTGTAVATTSALITGKQIKNSSITGADVKNKSLTPKDFRGSVRGPRGLRGFTGPSGAKGDKGDKGDTGAAGRSALTPLQSGETVYGTVGAQVSAPAASIETAANAQLPIPAPVALTDATVTVDGGEDTTTCTGTNANPTAPPGNVCIYPYAQSNAETVRGWIWGSGDGSVKWGFQLSWVSGAADETSVFATWAYTAP
jgi:hypothetical protein